MSLFLPAGPENQYLVLSEEFDCYDGFGHGIFQMHWLFICSLTIFLRNCHFSVIPLVTGDVDHWCNKPQHWNASTQEWKNVAIPLEADGQYSRCRQYVNPYNHSDTRTEPCTTWEYDEQQATTSVVSQWDMVCDRRLLRTALVAFHAAGLTIIAIAAGSVADTVGRRPVLLAVTVSLLASTLGLFLGSSYPVHAVANVIASGSVAAQFIVAGVLFFEVTTHENRPLHIVIAAGMATVVSDLWFAVMRLRWFAGMHWTLKQTVFLAPTFLSVAIFFAAVESPRWLVANARFHEAEDIMLAAAETNLFPLYNTACLLDKLKSKAADSSHPDQHSATIQMLQGVSIRKRAVTMLFTYFSVHFVLRALFSSIVLQDLTLHWISLALTVFGLVATLFIVTRVTLLRFISTCIAILGVLQCMSSLTINLDFLVLQQVLVVSARALVFDLHFVIASYGLELFPTTVRCSAAGWIVGFGGLGSIVASLSKLLEEVGREDVSFAVGGSLMFASLLFLRTLPRNTTAECAKIAVKSPSIFKDENVDRMKKTLERHEYRDNQEITSQSRRSKSSNNSQRSTSSSRSRRRKRDVK